MSLLSVRREVGEFRKRYKWMALAVLVVFAFIFGRMIQLQLVNYNRYAATAQENIRRTSRLPATRGRIYDVNGHEVATNRPSYNVYLIPQYLEQTSDPARIAELLALETEEREEFFRRLARVRHPDHRFLALRDVDRDQVASLTTHEEELCRRVGSQERRLPCVQVISEPVRVYPYGALGSHLVGYLNEIAPLTSNVGVGEGLGLRTKEEVRGLPAPDDMEVLRERGYRPGDRIGRVGIEGAWESYLRGRPGLRRTFVDVRGDRIDESRALERPPLPGRDVHLTLDMDLMRIIERNFSGHAAGAAVVVDVETGAVRALYSKPSYDLSEMTAGMSKSRYSELRDDPFRPLIDKTVYEVYPPGSILKPIFALAALESRLVDPHEHVTCTGSIEVGGQTFDCTHAHGEVDMHQALVRSCNTYFYGLAQQLGSDGIAEIAHDFGLGIRTGVGINAEAPGRIPTREWFQEAGNQYRLGHTLLTGIGQWETRVTLLQIAMAYAALANRRQLFVPQLVSRVTGPDGEGLSEFTPRVRRTLELVPEHMELLTAGLLGVVNEEGGTAFRARLDDSVVVAGKTGTAEIHGGARRTRTPEARPYPRRPHAWFAGYAPADNPRVAIVVMVEHGGSGGRTAAPIALRVLREYLPESSEASAQSASVSPDSREGT